MYKKIKNKIKNAVKSNFKVVKKPPKQITININIISFKISFITIFGIFLIYLFKK